MLDRELLTRLGWSDELIEAAVAVANEMDKQGVGNVPEVILPDIDFDFVATPLSSGFSTLGVVAPIEHTTVLLRS